MRNDHPVFCSVFLSDLQQALQVAEDVDTTPEVRVSARAAVQVFVLSAQDAAENKPAQAHGCAASQGAHGFRPQVASIGAHSFGLRVVLQDAHDFGLWVSLPGQGED